MRNVNLSGLRSHNTARVLGLLRAAGGDGVSRLELAERTGLTPQAVSKIAARLREEGLVAGAGRGPATGGKPRTLLRLVPGAAHAVGLHLDRDRLTAVLVDLAGVTVAVRTGPLDLGAGPAHVVAVAAAEVSALRGGGTLMGVGVAMPGPLDHVAGVPHRVTGFPAWDGYPLRDALRAALRDAGSGEALEGGVEGAGAGVAGGAPPGRPAAGRRVAGKRAEGGADTGGGTTTGGAGPGGGPPGAVASTGAGGGAGAGPGEGAGAVAGAGVPPVAVDKDTNAAALALALREPGGSSFAYVHAGTGLGAGLVLDGAVYRGARTGAGEFGHQTVQLDGAPCGCGGRGCLEALCLAAVARGDLDGAARVLGVGVANLAGLLDIDRVLLGGRVVAKAPERFVRGVGAALAERARLAGGPEVPAALAPGTPHLVAEGAAQLVLAPVFGR
ncbi:ROK family transcriptional regulator [Streptomyces rubrolavendulae]|uniref:N-acetylglucosamine repressor n=1 Tax=Streptomyces rubrolavendulae TaxID=285473 RepID=A0A1D8G0V1_9ACTN|nr:ROK family protein [Streptomyces rubrolavendulae]AOT59068.1 N-acetylglucosamine repressor [Streptomyces rubrolavendulae]